MIGPSQERGIVETTHLGEQTFEETLAATRGLVMAVACLSVHEPSASTTPETHARSATRA